MVVNGMDGANGNILPIGVRGKHSIQVLDR
jgi:hypothetical protein